MKLAKLKGTTGYWNALEIIGFFNNTFVGTEKEKYEESEDVNPNTGTNLLGGALAQKIYRK